MRKKWNEHEVASSIVCLCIALNYKSVEIEIDETIVYIYVVDFVYITTISL